MRTKLIPHGAKLVPASAKRVFEGIIYDVYQWEQKQFDGSFKTFEMLKHRDVVYTFGVAGGKIAAVHQLQPGWRQERLCIPGGYADEGEMPLEAARRETLEETGYAFDHWRLVEVIQVGEHVEAFIYYFIAWGDHPQQALNQDAGEKLRPGLFTLGKLQAEYRRSNDYRLAPLVLERVESLDELLALPEFQGRESVI